MSLLIQEDHLNLKQLSEIMRENYENVRQISHRTIPKIKEYSLISFGDKKGKYYFLSNSYPSKVSVGNHSFECAWDAYDHIIGSAGRRQAIDEKTKISAMKSVLQTKFSPGKKMLMNKIDATGEAGFEYESIDDFWGCGQNSIGHNNLGKLLEEIRFQLRLSKVKIGRGANQNGQA
jgi:hypothetical protein